MAHSDHRFGADIALLARTWRAELDRRLSHLGLSQARWLVLLHLARYAQAPTQSELAAKVGVECATLARLLDGLEAQQLVRRVTVAEDRRAKRIELLPGTETLIAQIEAIASELRGEILANIDQQDLEVCQRVLGQMQANLERR
ncbi:MarR family transcriptional regulator, transcriptional regulator for hemolysin [Geopseudomonas sagittaria]|uniref:MarR family transcriptional regulator, transcriptional regulator for hemolysin n=1 Tax=Geopseudomonas sagittaria TaxID=1135990 RepID=A0A1I5U220_9GAMM|nr:MarR family transcriptional regulator [Pseudomonas sagittaria]MCM2331072.1 MarR family transcriptional regulator [Pseudomonas sagittaria]SFP88897.1 MarR family transcriptional regulator, transcriptional regulator for hemolysin [Pseudomonas sagittaria]